MGIQSNLFFLDSLITNRITKKYLDVAEFEHDENIVPTNRKRRGQKIKNSTSTAPDSDFVNEAQEIPVEMDKVIAEVKHLDSDNQTQTSSLRAINPSDKKEEEINKKRKEVVRYVEIPSSFPHFPRLTDLYNSNLGSEKEMLGSPHARLPITDQNQKVRCSSLIFIQLFCFHL